MKTRIYTNIDSIRNTKETIDVVHNDKGVYIEIVKSNDFGSKQISLSFTKDEFQALVSELQKVS